MTENACPQCGGEVRPVFLENLFLNEDQQRALRAGDFYCEKCPSNGRGRKPLCYWWDRELGQKSVSPDVHLRSIARPCDIAPDASLVLIRELNGDVVVCITNNGGREQTEIRFALLGGKSPNTHRALVKLMQSMNDDLNQDNPLCDGIAAMRS